MKADLLQAVLTAVEAETEVSASVILSKSRKEEVVDARHIVVRMLADHNLYPSQIAELTNLSVRYIGLILNDFAERCKTRRIMRINYELSRKKFGINYMNGKGDTW